MELERSVKSGDILVMENGHATHRSSHTGRFVTRGTKMGSFTAIGTAHDGTVIVEPKVAPKSATKSAIRAAVRSVKERYRPAAEAS